MARIWSLAVREGGHVAKRKAEITANLREREVTEEWRKLQDEGLRR
jgi:hypothetical protein